MEKISFRNDILPLKNKLFRLALRITLNNADAEDIVQETLIKVWKKRESWNEIESIEAFCYSICRNLALDRTRRADMFSESLDETQYMAVDTSYSSNPEEQVQQSDRMKLVKELIDHLPEKQRSVIQLRDFEGKSYKEIADIMQMTDEMVKVTLFRARQTIKKKFLETEDYGL
ncbi:MAG: RNA polymerase sigma factor [Prevotella sp.]